MKSGSLNFLEPSGPLQACNETAATALLSFKKYRDRIVEAAVQMWGNISQLTHESKNVDSCF